MKHRHMVVAGLVTLATLAGTAHAQGRPEGMGAMNHMGPGAMAGQPQRQGNPLAQLRADLKLTSEQEPLWLAYTDKMKSQVGKKGQSASMPAGGENMTAPERMARMQTQMEERLASMKTVHESFNHLYAALTPEQKTIADQYAARMGQGAGRRGAMQHSPSAVAPQQKP